MARFVGLGKRTRTKRENVVCEHGVEDAPHNYGTALGRCKPCYREAKAKDAKSHPYDDWQEEDGSESMPAKTPGKCTHGFSNPAWCSTCNPKVKPKPKAKESGGPKVKVRRTQVSDKPTERAVLSVAPRAYEKGRPIQNVDVVTIPSRYEKSRCKGCSNDILEGDPVFKIPSHQLSSGRWDTNVQLVWRCVDCFIDWQHLCFIPVSEINSPEFKKISKRVMAT